MLNKYVLIVDDSQTNSLLLKALLFENEIDSKVAFSALAAWDLIRQQKPQLILLDLLMPRVSGFQLLENLKNNDELAAIPVIVVSALCEPDTEILLKEMGATDFFQKPVNLAQLLLRLRQLLETNNQQKDN